MSKKNKKRDSRARAGLTWAITFIPAMLAAVTAFWNTKDQGGSGHGNGKSKRSKRSKPANASA